MLMKITPDGAQKLIRSLEEDRHQLVEKINKLSTFVVAVSEGNPEDLRPEFDCMGTIKEIDMIDQKIRAIKHAKNVFNTLTYIPEEKITMDEALVLMAMLNKNYEYYTKLGNKERKERNRTGYGNEIEYTYTNYDIQEVKTYGKSMYERMLEVQSKLNVVNSTYTFEVNL